MRLENIRIGAVNTVAMFLYLDGFLKLYNYKAEKYNNNPNDCSTSKPRPLGREELCIQIAPVGNKHVQTENNYSDLRKREERAVIAVCCASSANPALQSRPAEFRASTAGRHQKRARIPAVIKSLFPRQRVSRVKARARRGSDSAAY